MDRPYRGSSISDLKLLFEINSADLEVLENILHELGFRKTKRARQLLAEVANRIADLSDEDDVFDGDDDDDNPESKPIKESETPKGHTDSSSVGSESLFGPASQDYELPPDDVKRPKNLGRIRPPGYAEPSFLISENARPKLFLGSSPGCRPSRPVYFSPRRIDS